VRTPLSRFLVIVGTAGAGLALGLVLLAPEVKAVLTAGHSGGKEDILKLSELPERSIVYARDGTVMAALHAEQNRSPVALKDVPSSVVNAVLDVEDDHFWKHNGVNLRATVRALVTNVNSGGLLQGGSTITQQLVKNALLTPEKSVGRKVKEAVLALRLEQALSKREILERYLNTVYLGNGAYGVQAGAETYYGRGVADLDRGQAAFLAGLIRNPVGYDPLRSPELARRRRDLALDRQVANGHMTADEAGRYKAEPVPERIFTPLPPPNDYFVEEVKQRLLNDRRLGDTPQQRYNAVFTGGLQIHTTFDPRMQDAAERKVHEILPDTRGKFTASLISVEPGTGAVRAMVAGDDFDTAHYNLATARGGSGRQPGSSFKAFVLMAALESGLSPKSTIDATSPCEVKVPGNKPYAPQNVEGEAGGPQTLTDATVHSINCAYVRLGADIGLTNVVDMAARFGIPRARLAPYPSLPLGTIEVSPLEMASAYAAIANDGVYVPPRFVESVLDRRGRVVFQGSDRGTRAVSVQLARETTQVLRQVVLRGTGTAAAVKGRVVAGKTGTSEEYSNAWFVGYAPQLATAVWMGSPVGNVPMRNVGGIRVFGGTYPARIWGAYMAQALDGLPVETFTEPDPSQIPAGKFIKDRYSSVRHLPTTTTSSSTSVLPGTTVPPTSVPAPTTTTTEAATTTTRPTTTTTVATTTTKPPKQ
jgi:penicillin-binding protein 1A